MTERFMAWWRIRSPREQKLLLVMAGVALIVLPWLLVVRPLNDALSDARARHGAAVIAVAEAREQVAAIRSLAARGTPTLGAPIDTMLEQSATEAGFTVTQVQREGPNAARIMIDAVRPQAFFGWVEQMEMQRGLIVDRLSATTNSDRTLSVEISFRARTS